jgi:hypothetical protein
LRVRFPSPTPEFDQLIPIRSFLCGRTFAKRAKVGQLSVR